MKTLCLRLAFALLLSLTAPCAALSAAPDGFAVAHGGALGQGGGIGLNPAGGGSMGALNPAGPMQPFGRAAPVERGRPFDDGSRFDGEGRFDHDAGHRFGHGGFRPHAHRFAYPLCYAYASCPLAPELCVWQDGYWTTVPVVTDEGFEVAQQVWVPPGCY